MSITLGIALYFIIWWTMLFAVLPLGVRTQDEEGNVVPGTPGSAPSKPAFRRIVLINTAVSCVVFAIVHVAIAKGLINLNAIGPGPH